MDFTSPDPYRKIRNNNYNLFLQEHMPHLQDLIQKAYNHKYYRHFDCALMDCGFSARVGFPLFLVWLILGRNLSDSEVRLAAVVIIVLGFYLRWFTKSVINRSFQMAFELNECHEIIRTYLEQCRASTLANSSSPSEHSTINEFFNFCKVEILRIPLDDFLSNKKSPR